MHRLLVFIFMFGLATAGIAQHAEPDEVYSGECSLSGLCEVQFSRGLFSDHMLRAQAGGYDYIGVSMDDIDLQWGREGEDRVDIIRIIAAMQKHHLDMAVPASHFKTPTANPFWYFMQNKACAVRRTNHVEIQFTVFTAGTFVKYQNMLRGYLYINPLGWGFDLVFPLLHTEVSVGVLNDQIVGIGGNSASESSYSHVEAKRGLVQLLEFICRDVPATGKAQSVGERCLQILLARASEQWTCVDTAVASASLATVSDRECERIELPDGSHVILMNDAAHQVADAVDDYVWTSRWQEGLTVDTSEESTATQYTMDLFDVCSISGLQPCLNLRPLEKLFYYPVSQRGELNRTTAVGGFMGELLVPVREGHSSELRRDIVCARVPCTSPQQRHLILQQIVDCALQHAALRVDGEKLGLVEVCRGVSYDSVRGARGGVMETSGTRLESLEMMT